MLWMYLPLPVEGSAPDRVGALDRFFFLAALAAFFLDRLFFCFALDRSRDDSELELAEDELDSSSDDDEELKGDPWEWRLRPCLFFFPFFFFCPNFFL
jgi:hypothetical protein